MLWFSTPYKSEVNGQWEKGSLNIIGVLHYAELICYKLECVLHQRCLTGAIASVL